MESKESVSQTTLACKLGDTPHVSGLAMRLAQTSGAGERLPEWLLKVAVERGARHYQREFDPALPPDNLRAAAQLLSSRRTNAPQLCRLAVLERCEPVLSHIAEIANKYAPQQEPWVFLRKHLPLRHVPRMDALPHWTRLVSYTGVTQQGPARTDWLCRHE